MGKHDWIDRDWYEYECPLHESGYPENGHPRRRAGLQLLVALVLVGLLAGCACFLGPI